MVTLTSSQKDSLRSSFEARGNKVEFTDTGMVVSKNGKTTKYTNEVLVRNFLAIKPKQARHSS